MGTIGMARCLWDPAKNRRLIAERGVSFEEVATLIESGALVDVFDHPDPKRPHQRIAVIEIGEYAYLVPYVETEAGDFFLKTIIPSRKATKKYLKER